MTVGASGYIKEGETITEVVSGSGVVRCSDPNSPRQTFPIDVPRLLRNRRCFLRRDRPVYSVSEDERKRDVTDRKYWMRRNPAFNTNQTK